MDDPFAALRADVLGDGATIPTPYGGRRLVYADVTASGRLLASIEAQVARVAETYANVHSEANFTAAQTNAYREEARAIIREAVGAADEDVVIFAGTGTTGAIHRLIQCMGLTIPCCMDDAHHLSRLISREQRPVVFIGPSEHHSNELPWRESIAEVVVVDACDNGLVDLDDLDRKLFQYIERPIKIGSFTAASNVTGLLSDVATIATILHEHSALALFDYAAAGPYVDINVNALGQASPIGAGDRVSIGVACVAPPCNPLHGFVVDGPREGQRERFDETGGGPFFRSVGFEPVEEFFVRADGDAEARWIEARGLTKQRLDYADAIFLSPHKFPGGPQTPGILVAKKKLFTNRVPAVPGGGTVGYADQDKHVYLQSIEAREEGGTPGIIESIRAGLVFQLKQQIGVDAIREREEAIVRRVLEAWTTHRGRCIHVLGNCDAPRIATFAIQIRHGEKLLHHNFVTALLNDLFGIQARGGLSCAAPYGHRLLGLDKELDVARAIETEVAAGNAGIRPAWCRISIPFYASDTVVDYIITSVLLIAEYGWQCLVDYDLDPCNGRWTHRGPRPPLASLSDLATMPPAVTLPEEVLPNYLVEAQAIMAGAAERARLSMPQPFEPPTERFEALRWFLVPNEAAAMLRYLDDVG